MVLLKNVMVLFLCATLSLLAGAARDAAAASVFDGGYESYISSTDNEWYNFNSGAIICDNNQNIRIVDKANEPGHVRCGNKAAEFTVINGRTDCWHSSTPTDERTEIQMTGENNFPRGSEQWISFSIKFPGSGDSAATASWHTSSYANLHQWKAGGCCPPAMSFAIDGSDNFYIVHYVNGAESGKRTLFKMNTDVWYDFMIRVKWSSGADGLLEVWHKTSDQAGYTLDFSENRVTSSGDHESTITTLHEGIYRGNPAGVATSSVFFDAYKIGTQRADVENPCGAGSGPTCSDGILNQGETSTDCGGPCPPCPDTTPPSPITALRAGCASSDAIRLLWTAPGDDGNTGTASQYDIRYSTAPITSANWDAATQAVGEPSPKPAGQQESFIVNGLAPQTKYYFAMKTGDEVPDWSGLSNIPDATTLNVGDTKRGCLPCAYCKRFEKWKTVCTMINQFCISNSIMAGFCTDQKRLCENKVDDLIAKCHLISIDGICTGS